MKDYLRCDTLEQFNQAWREAALGTPAQTKRYIGEVLVQLDRAVGERSDSQASVQAVRGYIESAKTAVKHSDSLGIVLALVAAMQELEHQPQNGRPS